MLNQLEIRNQPKNPEITHLADLLKIKCETRYNTLTVSQADKNGTIQNGSMIKKLSNVLLGEKGTFGGRVMETASEYVLSSRQYLSRFGVQAFRDIQNGISNVLDNGERKEERKDKQMQSLAVIKDPKMALEMAMAIKAVDIDVNDPNKEKLCLNLILAELRTLKKENNGLLKFIAFRRTQIVDTITRDLTDSEMDFLALTFLRDIQAAENLTKSEPSTAVNNLAKIEVETSGLLKTDRRYGSFAWLIKTITNKGTLGAGASIIGLNSVLTGLGMTAATSVLAPLLPFITGFAAVGGVMTLVQALGAADQMTMSLPNLIKVYTNKKFIEMVGKDEAINLLEAAVERYVSQSAKYNKKEMKNILRNIFSADFLGTNEKLSELANISQQERGVVAQIIQNMRGGLEGQAIGEEMRNEEINKLANSETTKNSLKKIWNTMSSFGAKAKNTVDKVKAKMGWEDSDLGAKIKEDFDNIKGKSLEILDQISFGQKDGLTMKDRLNPEMTKFIARQIYLENKTAFDKQFRDPKNAIAKILENLSYYLSEFTKGEAENKVALIARAVVEFNHYTIERVKSVSFGLASTMSSSAAIGILTTAGLGYTQTANITANNKWSDVGLGIQQTLSEAGTKLGQIPTENIKENIGQGLQKVFGMESANASGFDNPNLDTMAIGDRNVLYETKPGELLIHNLNGAPLEQSVGKILQSFYQDPTTFDKNGQPVILPTTIRYNGRNIRINGGRNSEITMKSLGRLLIGIQSKDNTDNAILTKVNYEKDSKQGKFAKMETENYQSQLNYLKSTFAEIKKGIHIIAKNNPQKAEELRIAFSRFLDAENTTLDLQGLQLVQAELLKFAKNNGIKIEKPIFESESVLPKKPAELKILPDMDNSNKFFGVELPESVTKYAEKVGNKLKELKQNTEQILSDNLLGKPAMAGEMPTVFGSTKEIDDLVDSLGLPQGASELKATLIKLDTQMDNAKTAAEVANALKSFETEKASLNTIVEENKSILANLGKYDKITEGIKNIDQKFVKVAQDKTALFQATAENTTKPQAETPTTKIETETDNAIFANLPRDAIVYIKGVNGAKGDYFRIENGKRTVVSLKEGYTIFIPSPSGKLEQFTYGGIKDGKVVWTATGQIPKKGGSPELIAKPVDRLAKTEAQTKPQPTAKPVENISNSSGKITIPAQNLKSFTDLGKAINAYNQAIDSKNVTQIQTARANLERQIGISTKYVNANPRDFVESKAQFDQIVAKVRQDLGIKPTTEPVKTTPEIKPQVRSSADIFAILGSTENQSHIQMGLNSENINKLTVVLGNLGMAIKSANKKEILENYQKALTILGNATFENQNKNSDSEEQEKLKKDKFDKAITQAQNNIKSEIARLQPQTTKIETPAQTPTEILKSLPQKTEIDLEFFKEKIAKVSSIPDLQAKLDEFGSQKKDVAVRLDQQVKDKLITQKQAEDAKKELDNRYEKAQKIAEARMAELNKLQPQTAKAETPQTYDINTLYSKDANGRRVLKEGTEIITDNQKKAYFTNQQLGLSVNNDQKTNLLTALLEITRKEIQLSPDSMRIYRVVWNNPDSSKGSAIVFNEVKQDIIPQGAKFYSIQSFVVDKNPLTAEEIKLNNVSQDVVPAEPTPEQKAAQERKKAEERLANLRNQKPAGNLGNAIGNPTVFPKTVAELLEKNTVVFAINGGYIGEDGKALAQLPNKSYIVSENGEVSYVENGKTTELGQKYNPDDVKAALESARGGEVKPAENTEQNQNNLQQSPSVEPRNTLDTGIKIGNNTIFIKLIGNVNVDKPTTPVATFINTQKGSRLLTNLDITKIKNQIDLGNGEKYGLYYDGKIRQPVIINSKGQYWSAREDIQFISKNTDGSETILPPEITKKLVSQGLSDSEVIKVLAKDGKTPGGSTFISKNEFETAKSKITFENALDLFTGKYSSFITIAKYLEGDLENPNMSGGTLNSIRMFNNVINSDLPTSQKLELIATIDVLSNNIAKLTGDFSTKSTHLKFLKLELIEKTRGRGIHDLVRNPNKYPEIVKAQSELLKAKALMDIAISWTRMKTKMAALGLPLNGDITSEHLLKLNQITDGSNQNGGNINLANEIIFNSLEVIAQSKNYDSGTKENEEIRKIAIEYVRMKNSDITPSQDFINRAIAELKKTNGGPIGDAGNNSRLNLGGDVTQFIPFVPSSLVHKIGEYVGFNPNITIASINTSTPRNNLFDNRLNQILSELNKAQATGLIDSGGAGSSSQKETTSLDVFSLVKGIASGSLSLRITNNEQRYLFVAAKGVSEGQLKTLANDMLKNGQIDNGGFGKLIEFASGYADFRQKVNNVTGLAGALGLKSPLPQPPALGIPFAKGLSILPLYSTKTTTGSSVGGFIIGGNPTNGQIVDSLISGQKTDVDWNNASEYLINNSNKLNQCTVEGGCSASSMVETMTNFVDSKGNKLTPEMIQKLADDLNQVGLVLSITGISNPQDITSLAKDGVVPITLDGVKYNLPESIAKAALTIRNSQGVGFELNTNNLQNLGQEVANNFAKAKSEVESLTGGVKIPSQMNANNLIKNGVPADIAKQLADNLANSGNLTSIGGYKQEFLVVSKGGQFGAMATKTGINNIYFPEGTKFVITKDPSGKIVGTVAYGCRGNVVRVFDLPVFEANIQPITEAQLKLYYCLERIFAKSTIYNDFAIKYLQEALKTGSIDQIIKDADGLRKLGLKQEDVIATTIFQMSKLAVEGKSSQEIKQHFKLNDESLNRVIDNQTGMTLGKLVDTLTTPDAQGKRSFAKNISESLPQVRTIGYLRDFNSKSSLDLNFKPPSSQILSKSSSEWKTVGKNAEYSPWSPTGFVSNVLTFLGTESTPWSPTGRTVGERSVIQSEKQGIIFDQPTIDSLRAAGYPMDKIKVGDVGFVRDAIITNPSTEEARQIKSIFENKTLTQVQREEKISELQSRNHITRILEIPPRIDINAQSNSSEMVLLVNGNELKGVDFQELCKTLNITWGTADTIQELEQALLTANANTPAKIREAIKTEERVLVTINRQTGQIESAQRIEQVDNELRLIPNNSSSKDAGGEQPQAPGRPVLPPDPLKPGEPKPGDPLFVEPEKPKTPDPLKPGNPKDGDKPEIVPKIPGQPDPLKPGDPVPAPVIPKPNPLPQEPSEPAPRPAPAPVPTPHTQETPAPVPAGQAKPPEPAINQNPGQAPAPTPHTPETPAPVPAGSALPNPTGITGTPAPALDARPADQTQTQQAPKVDPKAPIPEPGITGTPAQPLGTNPNPKPTTAPVPAVTLPSVANPTAVPAATQQPAPAQGGANQSTGADVKPQEPLTITNPTATPVQTGGFEDGMNNEF